jgi:hypothetical protein
VPAAISSVAHPRCPLISDDLSRFTAKNCSSLQLCNPTGGQKTTFPYTIDRKNGLSAGEGQKSRPADKALEKPEQRGLS